MATLSFLAIGTIHQIFDLADAFSRCNYNLIRSFRYLQAKERLDLYEKYCREVWLSAKIKRLEQTEIDFARNFHENCEIIEQSVNKISKEKMKRNVLDFGAIEAGYEAFECIDSSEARRMAAMDFVNAEREHFTTAGYDEIEVLSVNDINTTFYEYSDKLPVYRDERITPLKEGISYTFTGYIQVNCERFSINFIINNDSNDVALHINPRLPQNYIVRNSRVKDTWGREEVSSALPFSLRRGTKFIIQVLVTVNCYMISVNGYHFAEYTHRLPYDSVTILEVKGDVDDVNVECSQVLEYPSRSPESTIKEIRLALEPINGVDSVVNVGEGDEIDCTNIPKAWRIIPKQQLIDTNDSSNTDCNNPSSGLTLPYYGVLPPKSLKPGRCLKIEGRVKLLPHSFYINLQQGQNIWPHQIIAFHFNPRFSKQSGAMGKAIVCRNAWFNGKWDAEERSELVTDFRPGKIFSLAIVCGKKAFEVFVNRKLICEYEYRVDSEVIDTVYIQGDIKLWDVVLENNITTEGKPRIYHNPAYTEEYIENE